MTKKKHIYGIDCNIMKPCSICCGRRKSMKKKYGKRYSKILDKLVKASTPKKKIVKAWAIWNNDGKKFAHQWIRGSSVEAAGNLKALRIYLSKDEAHNDLARNNDPVGLLSIKPVIIKEI